MTDQLMKALAFNQEVRLFVVKATETVEEAHQRHDTWQTATAALGRTLIATSLLAANLKGKDRLNVVVDGQGPLGRIMAEAYNDGRVRGFASQPHVALPLNAAGKIDVAGGVGLPGTLIVKKTIEDSLEPYVGQVPLVSGELGEDFTYYMAVSEQTPSAIGLSVLVAPDESVLAAGGFMIQVLPGASEETITALEDRLQALGRFSDLIDQGKSLEELADILVGAGNYRELDRQALSFHCPCSKGYYRNRLAMIGSQELKTIIAEDHGAEVVCHYCNEVYQFSESDLQAMVAEIEQRSEDLD
ncbi:Hsp33 family molecular chaperone HslO [Eremococcus coleocola]|uniref:33 kDa chaperonin n=1 Tax=Eremococcus coleocola ACS-139-V-Col8 TaxID=908337 RepID=E4KMT4_9LACT|nr:Hsp33 family molecular chaperone HslO [Eremococcus coleocola]EFR31657.1 chaperonin HslO [Eremococcus coleocola ACS-139-V-Col8]